MSVMREELHHLIDRLPEEQVAPMLALVRESLPAGEDGDTLWPLPSFVGTLASGKGDVAARSQEILREEIGRDVPLGLVDASVIAVAERVGADSIATLDRRQFSVVRPRHMPAFRLLPDGK